MIEKLSSFDREVVNIGGTGRVSHFLSSSPTDKKFYDDLIVKESYPSTKEKILYECQILQSLESVPNIERCLCSYSSDDHEVSVLTPYVNDALSPVYSSLAELRSTSPSTNDALIQRITFELLKTAVMTVGRGIVTSDLQLLIQPAAPPDRRLLLIDLTEAKQVDKISPSSLDVQEIEGFLLEIRANLALNEDHEDVLSQPDVAELRKLISSFVSPACAKLFWKIFPFLNERADGSI